MAQVPSVGMVVHLVLYSEFYLHFEKHNIHECGLLIQHSKTAPQSEGLLYRPTDKSLRLQTERWMPGPSKCLHCHPFPKLLYHCDNTTAKGSKVNVYSVYISVSLGMMLLLSSVRFTLLCKSKCSKPQAK